MKIILAILIYLSALHTTFAQALLSNDAVSQAIQQYISAQEVPLKIDQVTTLQSVEEFGIRGIQYNYQLNLTVNDLGGEVGLKNVNKTLTSQNLNVYCDNPTLLWYKDNVVEMVWKYRDKNNSDLFIIRINANDCY
ncbi:MAG: hypothetical protein ACPGKG_04575 [Paracoccaceae bacterium]